MCKVIDYLFIFVNVYFFFFFFSKFVMVFFLFFYFFLFYFTDIDKNLKMADKKKRESGVRYCCVMNCSNNAKTTIDERTGKPVRFHSFPNPTTERERY